MKIIFAIMLACSFAWADAPRVLDMDAIRSTDHSRLLLLPTTVGGAGTVLTTNGSGVLSWGAGGGGGANPALSNLASVAINSGLTFGTGTAGVLKTVDEPSIDHTQSLTISTGSAPAGVSGGLIIKTGDEASPFGGAIDIHPGAQLTATETGAALTLSAGLGSTTGPGGVLTLSGGNTGNNGVGGNVVINGGASAFNAKGGDISLLSGLGGGGGGSVGGNIKLDTNAIGRGGSANNGKLLIVDGSEVCGAGCVWTEADGLGTGGWAPGGLTNPVPNATYLNWVNSTSTGNIPVLEVDASNDLFFGETTTGPWIKMSPGDNFIAIATKGAAGEVDLAADVFALYGATGSGNATVLQLWNASQSNFTGFTAPAGLATNLPYTLPATQSAGALTNDGSGNLSWAAGGGGGVTNPLNNNVPLQWKDSGAVARNVINVTPGDTLKIGGAITGGPFSGGIQIGDTINEQGIEMDGLAGILILTSQDGTGTLFLQEAAVEIFPGGGSVATTVKFDAANAGNFVGLKAPDTLAGSTTFTLPAADGASGQTLKTNGSGTLSFSGPPSGTVCGWHDTSLTVNCQGVDPASSCPTGYTQKIGDTVTFCAAN